jgi:hypothetical protein
MQMVNVVDGVRAVVQVLYVIHRLIAPEIPVVSITFAYLK